jgi:lysine 6-dehydrogenase
VFVRVAVLGAAGTIAPAIVRDLAESEEVESILLLDLDGTKAGAVAAAQGRGKAEARAADARSGLADELRGCAALVNSASYRVNLDAMRACLEAGCHYLDLGGLYRMTGRQLELGDDFERAGLLAVLGIGSRATSARSGWRRRDATSTRPRASAFPTRSRPCSTS